MTVLIASVFAPGTWDLLEVQRSFIARTTSDYVHAVASPDRPPDTDGIVWLKTRRTRSHRRIGARHVTGLGVIAKWFRRQGSGSFSLGVVCDSDAFPVRAEWSGDLVRLLKTSHSGFAAPVRVENLDCFPHISFVAFLPNAMEAVLSQFKYGIGKKLLRGRKSDVAAGLPPGQCLPLLKSNVWSPHATMHTIYSDMVYHRGRGSRTSGQRGDKYWSRVARRLTGRGYDSQPITVEWINRLLGECRFTCTGEIA